MPIREYKCKKCRVKIDVIEAGEPNGATCPDCLEMMEPVEFSVPARVTVGKYGKGGGRAILPPEGEK